MKIKLKAQNADKPYEEEEIELMLSLAPTRINVKNLAASFKRSRSAIRLLYRMAYSGNWLKNNKSKGEDNVHTKIARVKRQLGIVVGHRPKAEGIESIL